MDVYDPLHICNHSDDSGRYAYAVTLQFYPTSISVLICTFSESVKYDVGLKR